MTTVSYFDEMNLIETEKDYRTKIAEKLEIELSKEFERFSEDKKNTYNFRNAVIKIFIAWAMYAKMINVRNIVGYEEIIKGKYGLSFKALESSNDDIVDMQYQISVADIMDKLEDVSNEIVDSTLRNNTDEYFFSQKRAERIARDESNRFSNIASHETAKNLGYRYHIWHSLKDKGTRKHHFQCDGQKKPIDRPFVVGEVLMMFPMDDSMGADIDEIIGCRCSVSYE